MQRRISLSIKDVLYKIRLKFREKKGLNLNKSYLQLIRTNHPANCLTLDLAQIPDLNLTDLSQIQFSFRNRPIQVLVQIEDRLKSLPRAFKHNKFGNSGPRMELQNLTKNTFCYYAVQFSQNVFVENDPGKKCKNYINTKYSNCDDEFIQKVLDKNYPPGFLPIWATNDTSKVTTSIVGNKNTFDDAYAEIVSGTAESECPLPCLSTDITSVFLDEKYDSIKKSRIDITFSNKVAITVTYFPKFSIASFMSELGGSMGMWLGLGVVQTMEKMVSLVCRIKFGTQEDNTI